MVRRFLETHWFSLFLLGGFLILLPRLTGDTHVQTTSAPRPSKPTPLLFTDEYEAAARTRRAEGQKLLSAAETVGTSGPFVESPERAGYEAQLEMDAAHYRDERQMPQAMRDELQDIRTRRAAQQERVDSSDLNLVVTDLVLQLQAIEDELSRMRAYIRSQQADR